MKWCVHFPQEDILIKRPCLKRACIGNKAAAAFLSYLLYKASILLELKGKGEHANTISLQKISHPSHIEIHKTQHQILIEMDNEMSDRTLRDTAIPLLVALKYLQVDETKQLHIYTVQLNNIQKGIDKAPTIAEILPTLDHLIHNGNTSDKYRKYFQRLAEILPQSAEILPTNIGNTSSREMSAQEACHEGLDTHFSNDKNREKNKDNYKKKKEIASSPSLPHSKKDIITHQHIHERPRTDQSVLEIIESLRGYHFSDPERSHQLQSAAMLLNLQPQLTLQDIEEAWKHGSDGYWRAKYDEHGMRISDLINLDKQGRHRIFAILNHKRRQQGGKHQPLENKTKNHIKLSASNHTNTSITKLRLSMTQQEAEYLKQQITKDSQTYNYDLQPDISEEQGYFLIKVAIGKHIVTIGDLQEWQQKFANIHQILKLKKDLDLHGKDL